MGLGATPDFSAATDALPALLYGCLGTIGLVLAGSGLALAIDVFGVMANQSRHAVLRIGTLAFVEIVRNTPFLVQIFYLFFALPTLGLRLNPTATAIIALGLNGGAYAVEIIRGGVQSIQRGQSEAGLALGLRYPGADHRPGRCSVRYHGDAAGPGKGRAVQQTRRRQRDRSGCRQNQRDKDRCRHEERHHRRTP